MKTATLVSMLAAAALPAAFGEDVFWNNPGTGSWFDASNWSIDPPGLPTNTDTVGITEGTAVIAAAGAEANHVQVAGTGVLSVQSGGTLSTGGLTTLFGGDLSISGSGTRVNTLYFAVGVYGSSTATIDDGAEVTALIGDFFTSGNSVIVGHASVDDSTSSGTLNVSGAGTVLKSTEGIGVGYVHSMTSGARKRQRHAECDLRRARGIYRRRRLRRELRRRFFRQRRLRGHRRWRGNKRHRNGERHRHRQPADRVGVRTGARR